MSRGPRFKSRWQLFFNIVMHFMYSISSSLANKTLDTLHNVVSTYLPLYLLGCFNGKSARWNTHYKSNNFRKNTFKAYWCGILTITNFHYFFMVNVRECIFLDWITVGFVKLYNTQLLLVKTWLEYFTEYSMDINWHVRNMHYISTYMFQTDN